MTSARLSPAANLLRNSKLFALPAAVPPPPSKPTSEPVAASDTSTTPYPTRAAIYTTTSALEKGDWGLKRALPGRAFKTTKTPVIRLRSGIDTSEHVADFDSAGDHVLTLQKWETVPVMIGNQPRVWKQKHSSVFHPANDNITSATPPSAALSLSHDPKAFFEPFAPDEAEGQDASLLDNQSKLEAVREQMRADLAPPSEEAIERKNKAGAAYGAYNEQVAAGTAVETAHEQLRSILDPLYADCPDSENPRLSLLRRHAITVKSEPGAILQAIRDQYKADVAAENEAAGRVPPPAPRQAPSMPVKTKRWRYKGPWLAGLSNLEFESYLSKLDSATVKAFREYLKQKIIADRQKQHLNANSGARGEVYDIAEEPSSEVSEEEISKHLQFLRHKPNDFGPEIAAFFDLARGPTFHSDDDSKEFSYPNDSTAASKDYEKFGPPRTHPSAGFSYLRSEQIAINHPTKGPMDLERPLPARIMKEGFTTNDANARKSIGVGGFIARLGQTGRMSDAEWRITPGGPKTSVTFYDAAVSNDGSLELGVNRVPLGLDKDNVPVSIDDLALAQVRAQAQKGKQPTPEALKERPDFASQEWRLSQGRRDPLDYRRVEDLGDSPSDGGDAVLKTLGQ